METLRALTGVRSAYFLMQVGSPTRSTREETAELIGDTWRVLNQQIPIDLHRIQSPAKDPGGGVGCPVVLRLRGVEKHGVHGKIRIAGAEA